MDEEWERQKKISAKLIDIEWSMKNAAMQHMEALISGGQGTEYLEKYKKYMEEYKRLKKELSSF